MKEEEKDPVRIKYQKYKRYLKYKKKKKMQQFQLKNENESGKRQLKHKSCQA